MTSYHQLYKITILFCLFLFTNLTSAQQPESIDLHGSFLLNDFPLTSSQLSTLAPHTHDIFLVVNSNSKRSYVTNSLQFSLLNLLPGIYRVDIISKYWHFEPIQVKIQQQQQQPQQQLQEQRMNNMTLGMPLEISLSTYFSKKQISTLYNLTPDSYMAYFEIRDDFSLLSMISSPSVLMMIFAVVLGLLTKSLMGRMSPEDLEEMKQLNKSMKGMIKNIQKGDIQAVIAHMDGSQQGQEQDQMQLENDVDVDADSDMNIPAIENKATSEDEEDEDDDNEDEDEDDEEEDRDDQDKAGSIDGDSQELRKRTQNK